MPTNEYLLCEGFLKIPVEGDYTFSVPPGVTALFRIHDAIVTDTAWATSDQVSWGTICLGAGIHSFQLNLAPATSPDVLQISDPDLPFGSIRATMLLHEG